MSEQAVQQRQTARPDPAASRARMAGPGEARLAQLAAALRGGVVHQLAPKKKLAQLAPKKKLAQLAPRKKLAQLAPRRKLAQLAIRKKPVQRSAGHIPVVAGEERMRPTVQMRQGVPVNDDRHLEQEADMMGARAVQMALAAGAPVQLAAAGPGGAAVVQRAVPTATGLPKPVPQTHNYNAQAAARKTMFTKSDFPRSKFSFGVYTRPAILKMFNPTGIGTHPSTVMTSTGHQVNTQAVQLDHYPQTWTNMVDVMDEHNRQQQHNKVPFSADTYYTLWDARMYYNDVTNLKPAMGSDNASGGSEGVQVAAPMHVQLQAALGYATHSMTTLQHVLGAYHESFQEDHLAQVCSMLTGIGEHASKVSDAITSFK